MFSGQQTVTNICRNSESNDHILEVPMFNSLLISNDFVLMGYIMLFRCDKIIHPLVPESY